ncbi:hypothetical protein C8R46DRAFT_1194302 [Mycena filopes]|nr:hypothetical protein C8R46DRAFT_1194302 [Mycena filopes]
MALLIAHITVAQAATVINILIAFLQYTLGLAIVALLIYFIPAVNPALAWNVIGRKLHASLWPTILRTDTNRGVGFRVAFFSYLSLITTILVAIAGVIMPLGLSVGPDVQRPVRTSKAAYVADASPLGLATSPRAGFRRYYNGTAGYNYSMPIQLFTTTESLILRTGIFAIDGLIVDLDNPGIGLWNHTLPTGTSRGAVWSEDVLWLEPVSSCVDTNMTIDYTLQNSFDTTQEKTYNLVDHGGFYNLTSEYPDLNRDGQNIDLRQHAYKGAVLSNYYTMLNLGNQTRNQSSEGKAYPINSTQTNFFAGKMQTISMMYRGNLEVDNTTITGGDLTTACEGYGGADFANISNVAVHCSMFLGPPQRTDGGDARLPGDNSTWSHRMFGCASGTRARMQRVTFSFNGTMDLGALRITRRDIDTPLLWATEVTALNITDVDLLWGVVPDALAADPALSTIRSDVFYVPAGAADIWGVSTGGQPSTLPALAWSVIGNILGSPQIVDYSGISNFALLRKFQELILADPAGGAARIQNLMWTDMMANNVLGTDTRATLVIGENVASVAYDLRYAIPALLLVLIWLPALAGALLVLVTGLLKMDYLRYLLTHTSSGRIALGDSALRPVNTQPGGYATPPVLRGHGQSDESETNWARGPGRTPVWVDRAGVNSNGLGEMEYKDGFAAVATHER